MISGEHHVHRCRLPPKSKHTTASKSEILMVAHCHPIFTNMSPIITRWQLIVSLYHLLSPNCHPRWTHFQPLSLVFARYSTTGSLGVSSGPECLGNFLQNSKNQPNHPTKNEQIGQLFNFRKSYTDPKSKNDLGPISSTFHVGRPEMLTEWKSESMTDQPTDWHGWVLEMLAQCASKKMTCTKYPKL